MGWAAIRGDNPRAIGGGGMSVEVDIGGSSGGSCGMGIETGDNLQ